MARKESITIDKILETAFELERKEGLTNVTARHVATAAGCSTQPIFRVYKNMEDLQLAVYNKAVVFFQEYYENYTKMSDTPFVDLGMAYVAFARAEKHLFNLLFMNTREDKKSMYELLNGKGGYLVAQINSAKEHGCPDPGHLFMKMWIFIHGAACMSMTGDYDLSDDETKQLLEKAYESFTIAG